MKNRWLITAAAVCIHSSLGSVYAWSVFKRPFMNDFGWNDFEAGLPFGLSIFLLGISAAIMGRVVERRGPRFSGTLAAVLWSFGLIGTGFATSSFVTDNSFRLLLTLFFCSVGGFGLGTGYISPVSTLMKWFPERRGFATGLAIMGFGFGSFIAGPIITGLIKTTEISSTFYILGIIYLFIMLISSNYLEVPPENWHPGKRKQEKLKDTIPLQHEKNKMVAKTLFKPYFSGLWLIMFINITCGISIISIASPMAQDITGASVMSAGALVGLIGLINGLGRIFWASLSDLIGRPNTYIAILIIQLTSFCLLPSLNEALLFNSVLLIIVTCYGGGFSTLPAYIHDIFGSHYVSSVHGYILTAWALAGLIGSSISSLLRQYTGGYNAMLQMYNCLLIVALIISVLMKIFLKRKLISIATQNNLW